MKTCHLDPDALALALGRPSSRDSRLDASASGKLELREAQRLGSSRRNDQRRFGVHGVRTFVVEAGSCCSRAEKREIEMSEHIEPELISRRKAFSFLGLLAGLAVVPSALIVSDAEAATAGMERRFQRRTGRFEHRTVHRAVRRGGRAVRRGL